MQADYIIINGRVVNVYTGETLRQNVAVKDDRILYVGSSDTTAGASAQVIDARGAYILPGFFDAHAHADIFCNPFSFARHVLRTGTTGFFNDGHDLANALGRQAFLRMTGELSRSVSSIYSGVPASSPPFPGVEGNELWTEEDLKAALNSREILSVSEVTPYMRIVKGDPLLDRRLNLARAAGKLIEGHTTGANVDKLNALARAGITSCHESITTEDVTNRLRLGYYVMLRQGSIRRELPVVAEAARRAASFDSSRLILVTDAIFPDHMVEWGYMDWVVAQAVKEGIPPVRAIQMATINPARYFRLDHLLGGIAPGRIAHLQFTRSLEAPTPHFVMARGTPAWSEGKDLLEELPPVEADLGNRPFTGPPLGAEDFDVAARDASSAIPVIHIVNQTVTSIREKRLSTCNGRYKPENGVLTVCLRSRDGGRMGQGFVEGFCSGLGGLASSAAHETHGLLVLGCNTADMASAANRVLELQGGIVLHQGGRTLAEIPLPLGGISSLKPVDALAEEISRLHAHLWEMGCPLDYPLWTLVFLSFTSVLMGRITYSGVYDVKRGKIVF